MNLIEYYKSRILALMADVEQRRNRYHRKETFECTYSELTERIWTAIDSKDKRALIILNAELCKLADSF